ncbi:MAG: SIMPL domain-containing protein [Acidimicrobiia bacterium]
MSNEGITVSSVGSASGPPDRAILTLGASALRAGAADALEVVNTKVRTLISTVAPFGIDGFTVQTTELSIWPERSTDGSTIGFRARNVVRITISEMAAIGEVVGAATQALGDSAEMHGLVFEVADPTVLEYAARGRAWELAVAKATQIAELAGTELGNAVEVTESTGRGPISPLPKTMAMAEAAPIETGATTVEVQLTVRFLQYQGDRQPR